MKVIDLFRRLAFGELSNLAIAGEGEALGTIVEAKHPQIIQYLNEGLLRLHSRFNLRQKDLLIEQVAHITNYHLRRQFAESSNDCSIPYPYIKDLPCEPFLEDVIRILEVHDQCGQRPLNDLGRSNSVFTPQPDVLQVPNPQTGAPLAIVYQARHEPIRDFKIREDENLLEQSINIPFFLEGALQAFIGSQVYSHMNGQENIMKAQEYLNKNEAICLEVEEKDLVGQSVFNSHYKFEQRGFV